MKVRHITKRNLCSWYMKRSVSRFVLNEQIRNGRGTTESQKRRLRYRDFWK